MATLQVFCSWTSSPKKDCNWLKAIPINILRKYFCFFLAFILFIHILIFFNTFQRNHIYTIYTVLRNIWTPDKERLVHHSAMPKRSRIWVRYMYGDIILYAVVSFSLSFLLIKTLSTELSWVRNIQDGNFSCLIY